MCRLDIDEIFSRVAADCIKAQRAPAEGFGLRMKVIDGAEDADLIDVLMAGRLRIDMAFVERAVAMRDQLGFELGFSNGVTCNCAIRLGTSGGVLFRICR